MAQYFAQEAAMTFRDVPVESVNTLFRKVYQWMAAGLALTAVTAYVVASSPAILQILFGSGPGVLIGIVIAEVALVLWLSMGINKISAGTAGILFTLYSALNGVMCSSVLLVYTQGSVYQAFISTAGMFALMSVYALYTQRDLTGFGSFLRMGLFGLVIAMVINMFVGSSMADFAISIFGVLIFLGLTAWDTWKIKQLAYGMDGTGETGAAAMSKVAIIGALALYLDFINIFLYMLRFIGKRK